MQYDKFNCVVIGSKDCSGKLSVSIQGDKGFISSNCATNSYENFEIKMNDGNAEKFELNDGKHRLYYEVVEFEKLVSTKDFENVKILNNKTLQVMKVLDDARSKMM